VPFVSCWAEHSTALKVNAMTVAPTIVRCKTTGNFRAVLIARRTVDRFRIRRHVSLMI